MIFASRRSRNPRNPLDSGGETVKRTNLLFALCVALALCGCNTVQGIGKDIEKGGQTIEKAAK